MFFIEPHSSFIYKLYGIKFYIIGLSSFLCLAPINKSEKKNCILKIDNFKDSLTLVRQGILTEREAQYR